MNALLTRVPFHPSLCVVQMSIMAEESAVASLCVGLSTPEMPLNTLVGSWKYSIGLCSTGQVRRRQLANLITLTAPPILHRSQCSMRSGGKLMLPLSLPHPPSLSVQILLGSRWYGGSTNSFRFGCGCTVGVLVHIDERRSSESWDGTSTSPAPSFICVPSLSQCLCLVMQVSWWRPL